eukprot:gene4227-biopygen4165
MYDHLQECFTSQVTFLFSSRVAAIQQQGANADALEAVIELADGRNVSLRPRLLVGSDGLRSTVRMTLERWRPEAGYKMCEYPSGSSGLRYKVMTLPAGFPLDDAGTISEHDMAYALVSKSKNRDWAFRFGILPQADPSEPRTANLITIPDHAMWNVKGGDELFDVLTEQIPAIPWRQKEVVARASRRESCFLVMLSTAFPRTWARASTQHSKMQSFSTRLSSGILPEAPARAKMGGAGHNDSA